jgi:hypothetical protein
MYKLSKSYVEKLGEEVCKKGVNVRGVILYKDWYSFRQEQTKLKDLINGNSMSSYLDYRIYSVSKNAVLYEKVEDSTDILEVLNVENDIKAKLGSLEEKKGKKKKEKV